MAISGPMEWWDEWQLRILVLASLFVQCLLFISAGVRKCPIPRWFRSIIWLAYIGSDALAIYALATLFSRQRRQDCISGQGNSILEVVWAPVLLVHLGGQDIITAYNIEDNELWTRHILTAVSQVTAAIYVFCTSWPGGDKRLLQASILFFVHGILKCLEKPWALMNASINSLVSSSNPALRREGEINSLKDYVQKIKAYIQLSRCPQAQGGHNIPQPQEEHNIPHAQEEHNRVDIEADQQPLVKTEGTVMDLQPSHNFNVDPEAYRIFVDLPSPYLDRLGTLESFWVLDDHEACHLVQNRLFDTFDFLYTKRKMLSLAEQLKGKTSSSEFLSLCIRGSATLLPWAAIALFYKSHREAYDHNDVKVTSALFWCTALLEHLGTAHSLMSVLFKGGQVTRSKIVLDIWRNLFPVAVGQYTLVGFFARNKMHSWKMSIVKFFSCKDFLDQRWPMKPCHSSIVITELVLKYVKKGWVSQIEDADIYWKFSDRRGQSTLQLKKCNQVLGWSLRRPFDESVLLWHIATNFCFYNTQNIADSSSEDYRRTVQCREMSNYMMYLLFVNPEMLLAGTRRNLFTTANAQLEVILENVNASLMEILKGDKPSLMEILKGDKPFLQFFTGKRTLLEDAERKFMLELMYKLKLAKKTEQVVEHTDSPPVAATNGATMQEGFIIDASKLAKALLALGENQMWDVIEGVWVEMLCFSASRCRGYLHAKSLGSGLELLTCIWLLLSYMGMETFPERLQRTELSSAEGNDSAPPSTSQASGSEDPQPHEAAADRASTS